AVVFVFDADRPQGIGDRYRNLASGEELRFLSREGGEVGLGKDFGKAFVLCRIQHQIEHEVASEETSEQPFIRKGEGIRQERIDLWSPTLNVGAGAHGGGRP